jgi:hypothetical protein
MDQLAGLGAISTRMPFRARARQTATCDGRSSALEVAPEPTKPGLCTVTGSVCVIKQVARRATRRRRRPWSINQRNDTPMRRLSRHTILQV